jgi:DNA-binding SARP family transcriptional activator/tetratricopeptide (TPR) repeat protein
VAEFRILGPLEVLAGPRRLELGGARQQIVLAMLLLNANGVVGVGRLEQAIYGEDLPPTSRTQAMTAVSALRRLLADYRDAAAISSVAQGYVLQTGDGLVDSLRFAGILSAAQAARDAGDSALAVAHYRDALRLWRGPALEGIDSLVVRAAATQLDEQRMAAIEERLGLELDLGRHHEVTGELVALAAEFPFRERLRGQLMVALYRSGRTAEALGVYQQVRQMMIDELGIEPGRELQRLQQAILAGDPALDAPAGPVTIARATPRVPRLLPADIADFTGRAEQVSQIREQLTVTAAGNSRRAVPVVVITGQGGVGKTSLALHAAHGLAGQFADGQLFADLHGAGAQPAGPAQVLERFLRALGVPGPQIPDGLDERAEVYRNLVAGRRVLVVLDDATAESQVQPLLPGSGSTAMLVTSRGALAGLAGAARIPLDVFDAGQSVELLGRIAGTGRVRAQPEAAAIVTGQCGHLPLALRIAGGRLAVRPHWDVRQLAERLADQARRLDELELGELGVRASISLSYNAASEPARRLLRRLALLEVPVFSGWVTAPLLDQQPADSDDVLDQLVSARLIEPTGAGPGSVGQYRFHDLIRLYARERLAAEEPAAEQRAALERALGCLLFLSETARGPLRSSYAAMESKAPRWPLPEALTGLLVSDPMAWFERERAALVAGVVQAADASMVELSWSVVLAAEMFLESRSHLDDWQYATETALAAARRAGDVRGQAAMLLSRGSIAEVRGQLAAARRDFDAAGRLFRGAGDDYGFALAIRLTAVIDREAGRLDAAAAGFERALATLRTTGDQWAIAYVLQNLARVRLESGDPAAARKLLTEALQLTEAGVSERVSAQVLYALGEVQLQTGQLTDAADTFARALAQVRALGDQLGEANVLCGIGLAATRQGQHDRARDALGHALKLADAVSSPLAAARARVGLSELALASGNAQQAIVLATRAAEVFGDLGASLEQARALNLLSDGHTAAGDEAAAETASAQASSLRASNPPSADVEA